MGRLHRAWNPTVGFLLLYLPYFPVVLYTVSCKTLPSLWAHAKEEVSTELLTSNIARQAIVVYAHVKTTLELRDTALKVHE